MKMFLFFSICFFLTGVLYAGPFGLTDIGEPFELESSQYFSTPVENLDAELGGYSAYRIEFDSIRNQFFSECSIIINPQNELVYVKTSADETGDASYTQVFNTMIDAITYAYGRPTSTNYIRDRGFWNAFIAGITFSDYETASWKIADGVVINVIKDDEKVEIEYISSEYDEYLKYKLPELRMAWEEAEEQKKIAEEKRKQIETEENHRAMIQSMSL